MVREVKFLWDGEHPVDELEPPRWLTNTDPEASAKKHSTGNRRTQKTDHSATDSKHLADATATTPMGQSLEKYSSRKYIAGSHELRKQISIFLPCSDWLILREEAARLNIPMTELCRRCLHPMLQELHAKRS